MILSLLLLVGLAVLWRPVPIKVPGQRTSSRVLELVGELRRHGSAWLTRRRHRVELGVVVTEVASRLRAGASGSQAWQRTLARQRFVPQQPERAPRASAEGAAAPQVQTFEMGADGVPSALLRLDVGRDAAGAQRLALAATVAACRLSHEVGAPLAQVLDRCAEGITEAAQARDARRVVLAGPRATARVLAWLPLVGLGLGTAIGARPLDVLLDGSWGSAALLSGLLLIVAGRRWSALLLRSAQHGHAGPSAQRQGAA